MSRRDRKKKRNKIRRRGGKKLQRVPLGEFESLPKEMQEIFARHLGEHSAASVERFDNDLQNFMNEIWMYDPLNLLTVVAYYGTVHRDDKLPDPRLVNPVNIELIQALALMRKRDLQVGRPALGRHALELIAKLQPLVSDFHHRRMGNPLESSPAEFKKKRFIEINRAITTGLRNGSIPQEVRRIAEGVFSAVDHDFEEVHGISATETLMVFDAFAKLCSSKVEYFSRKLKNIFRPRGLTEQVQNFCKEFPGLISETEWTNGLIQMNAPATLKRAVLLSRADTEMTPLFTHSLSELSTTSRVAEPRIARVLDQLSFEFGDLESMNPEFFFLDNPIWRKPLVKLDTSRYLLPCSNLFTSHLIEILETLVAADKALKTKYEEQRSIYLEKSVAELFSEVFPRGEVYSGSRFEVDGILFENDLAILVERSLFLVECKAGKLHDAARRGAMGQLKTDIEELIVSPNDQAKRFAELLMSDRRVHHFPTKDRKKSNRIDSTQLIRTIPLTIVFSSLGGIGIGTETLRDSGLVPAGKTLQPVISLADLRWLNTLLPSEMIRYDYLHQRTIIEAEASYVGDEMDLIALYLDRQFNHLMDGFFYGKSEDLNPYFHKLANSVVASPPILNVHKEWNQILERVDRMGTGWSEAASILLRRDKFGQRQVLNRMKKVCQKAWKAMKRKELHWEAEARDDLAIMCCSQFGLTSEERSDLIADAVVELREEHDSRHVIALCQDLDHRGPQRRDFADELAVLLFLRIEEDELNRKIRAL